MFLTVNNLEMATNFEEELSYRLDVINLDNMNYLSSMYASIVSIEKFDILFVQDIGDDWFGNCYSQKFVSRYLFTCWMKYWENLPLLMSCKFVLHWLM